MQLQLKPGNHFVLSDIRALRLSCIHLLSPLHATRSILTLEKKLNNPILPLVDEPTWKPWNSRLTSSFKHLWMHMKITINQSECGQRYWNTIKEQWGLSEVCRNQDAKKMTHAYFSAKCRFSVESPILWSWSQLYVFLGFTWRHKLCSN